MSKEFINERNSYTSHVALATENPLEIKENNFSVKNPFSSTIASCADYPLSIPSARFRPLFLELENSLANKEFQQKVKQKESFLKSLSLANLKIQITNFYTVIRDTLVRWQNDVQEFFRGHKPLKVEKISTPTSTRKAEVSKPTKMEKMQESVPDSTVTLDDLEKKRIQEIDESLKSYEAEMERSGGSMSGMIELASKIMILLSSLGYRFNKKEMQDYLKHLEVNVKQRVKTFQGGKTWTYISVAIQGGAALISIGAFAGGFVSGASLVGKILTNLGNTSSSISYFGQATSKIGEVESEKRTAQRTLLEHYKEQIELWKRDNQQIFEKTLNTAQTNIELIRSLERERAQATRSAAAAA